MKIAVIGIGTAGVMSLCHMLRWCTNAEVTSIYDPSIKILGIGESADPGFVTTLFEGANFNMLDDAAELDATFKFGVTWKNWREKDFTMLMYPPSYAMHFNNFRLYEFAFSRFKSIWKDRFKILNGTVSKLENQKTHVVVGVDTTDYIFDYVIDCRGYPEDYSNYTMLDLPVNHCLVHVVDQPGNWNTTIVQACKNGWMFGIPLKTRQGWGYLYNDKINTKDEIISEIKEMFNTPTDELREFSFVSYYANEFFDGRILKNGNRALFLEPLEALNGIFYSEVLRAFYDYVSGDRSINDVNYYLTENAKNSEMFIDYAYHGGSLFNSNFWNASKELTSAKLKANKRWTKTIHEIKECFDSRGNIVNEKVISNWFVRHWEKWDQNLGYKYF